MKRTRQLLDDCFLHDKDRLRHADALALLQERLTPIAGVETVRLEVALNRVLAQDVLAPRPVPAHTNAAVDGYATDAASLVEGVENTLLVSMRIPAGRVVDTRLEPGTAARIFTGASLPKGADTVVMQEDCEAIDQDVVLPAGVKLNMNVRQAGEDVAIGDVCG